MRKTKKNRLNALSLVGHQLQKMENITFGAHAQNVELKKQDLSKTRETNSALSRRGAFWIQQHPLAPIFFFNMGFPGLVKKTVEMGRYYESEALRNPKIQKKALDFALDQLSPMIHNVGSQALDELSTKIRPKKIIKFGRWWRRHS